jgi:hypothetical protein
MNSPGLFVHKTSRALLKCLGFRLNAYVVNSCIIAPIEYVVLVSDRFVCKVTGASPKGVRQEAELGYNTSSAGLARVSESRLCWVLSADVLGVDSMCVVRLGGSRTRGRTPTDATSGLRLAHLSLRAPCLESKTCKRNFNLKMTFGLPTPSE